jgi:hypothetical protein
MWNKEKKSSNISKIWTMMYSQGPSGNKWSSRRPFVPNMFLNTRFLLHSCQIVCVKENSYWMKTTYPLNFFRHGGYFYDNKDVDIHLPNICTQLYLKNPTTIVFNQLSQIFSIKRCDMFHQNRRLWFYEMKFDVFIAVPKNIRLNCLVLDKNGVERNF